MTIRTCSCLVCEGNDLPNVMGGYPVMNALSEFVPLIYAFREFYVALTGPGQPAIDAVHSFGRPSPAPMICPRSLLRWDLPGSGMARKKYQWLDATGGALAVPLFKNS